MIDLGRKLVILHPPKTGGQSVQKALIGHDGPLTGDGVMRHATREEINTLMPETKDWTTAILVRNPYERLVSFYFFMKKPQKGREFEWTQDMRKSESFEEWLECVDLAEIANLDVPMDMARLWPMNRWGEADVVLHQETLQEDLEKLVPGVQLIRHNATRHPKTHIWNQEILDKVYEVYEEDFKRFGYSRRMRC